MICYPFRLLYGKMQCKVKKTSSNLANMRQAIVFKFLAGCHTSEINTFLNMVFMSFKHFITDTPLEMVKDTLMNTALDKVITLRRITG